MLESSEALFPNRSTFFEYAWRCLQLSRKNLRKLNDQISDDMVFNTSFFRSLSARLNSLTPPLSREAIEKTRSKGLLGPPWPSGQIESDFIPGGGPKRPLLLSPSPFPFFSYLDSNYPEKLKALNDPPFIIYHSGQIKLLKSARPFIGVVGTRRASTYAMDVCKSLIQEMVRFNPVIVSGMAYGIDSAAHRASLEVGLNTVGVLGNSLKSISLHQGPLFKEMEERALLLSEIYPGAPMGPWRFPERNRIIAALSDALILVETPEKSGALITAHLALELGKDIFVVPGPLTRKRNHGGHQLIQQGAHLLTSSHEIFEHLNIETAKKQAKPSNRQELKIPSNLDKNQGYLLKILSEGAQHIDKIATISQIPAPLVMSTLMELCLLGLIVELPGRMYQLKD